MVDNEVKTMKKKSIAVLGNEIVLYTKGKGDYISITDIARYKNPLEPKDIVKN
jgi:hypothetical protein